MATIRDVARAAGVSAATVSRSFTDGHPLNQETRRRVLQEANRLNYQPPRSRGVRKSSVRNGTGVGCSIGFEYFGFTPTDALPTNSFYGPVLAGAQSEADALGMNMMIHTTYRHMQVRSVPQMIAEQAVEGMLLVGTADPAIVSEFVKFVPKIVIVDNLDSQFAHDCVTSDGFNGARIAVEYLMSLGHRRIAFVMSRENDVPFCDRLSGYINTLFRAGLEIERRLVWTIDEPSTDISVEVSQAVEMLRLHAGNLPTAVVAANDSRALAMMQACRHLGISVPGDMSIVGFDDIDLCVHAYPTLTTIRIDKEEMGRVAVRRLHMRMREERDFGSVSPSVAIQIPVSLVERSSSAPPRHR